MGDNTINPSATTAIRPAQTVAPTAPVQQAQPPQAAEKTVAQQPTDKAAVGKTGSSATSVSLVDGPAPVAGIANGPFEYNDKAVTLFSQFASSGKIHSGRIPTLDTATAAAFSKDLLTKISLANGAGASDIAAQLDKADPIRTLQQVVGARTDGRFGPETLYKTVQLVQTLIQHSDSPEKLAKAQQVIGAFAGKVRGLDDMLAAQTLRVGENMINNTCSLDELKAVETRLQPLLSGNPTLGSILSNKQIGLQAEADRASAAAKAAEEGARADKNAAEADAQKKAKETAEAQTLKERQGAIDAAITPVKGSGKGDDTARHLVSKGYNRDATTSQKVTLLKEMLSGPTGDDDEKAILQILKDDIAANKINETLTALGNDKTKQLFDDLNGAENDQLLTALFTSNNVAKSATNMLCAHMIAQGYEGKLVELAKGKRGQLSDTAAPVVLNNLMKVSPAGKDEAVRSLKTRIGMEGLITGKVDMSRLYGHMGKDKEKAAFVVDILKTADGFQAKINAAPAGSDEQKKLTEARDYALDQAKAAISNADDDQTVEFLKAMIGDSKKPTGLRSFANLPEPLLNQLHKNLDSFWNNTWKTDEEKAYRQIVEDALAVKRRQAFGSDGDKGAVPGSAATGYSAGGQATATATEPAKAPEPTKAPEPVKATVAEAPAPTPIAGKNPEDESGQPGSYIPGAAASVASTPAKPKSPNND